MNKLLMLAVLAFSATTPLVEAGTGLMTDCVMELLGVRGVCSGICMFPHVVQNMDQINKTVTPCLMNSMKPLTDRIGVYSKGMDEVIKAVGDDKDTTLYIKAGIDYYQKIYKEMIADRTLICTMMSAEEKCFAPVAKAGCADLGDEILKGIMTFAKSNLGCAYPKTPVLLSCVASPEVIKEVVDDVIGLMGGAGGSNCFMDLMKDTFVIGMMPIFSQEGETMIQSIASYVKTNTNSLCSLVDKGVACIASKLEGKAACPKYTIDNMKENINDFKNKVLGCSSDNYYDLLTCGLDIDFWNSTITATCPFNTDAIGAAFMALVNAKGNASAVNVQVLQGLCGLADNIECIINAVKASTNCASGLVLDTLNSLTGPMIQWLDFLQTCTGRTKTMEITDCKCLSSTFPIGDAKTGTCPASDKRGDPRCSSNPVLDKKMALEGGVGHVLPSISILVTSLLLTL